MTLDAIEQQAFNVEKLDVTSKLKELNSGFDSKIQPKNGVFQKLNPGFDVNVANWVEGVEASSLESVRADVYKQINSMFKGIEVDGKMSTGLDEIARRYSKTDRSYASLKSQAGYSAEIINATKENIKALSEKTGIRTIRTDDISKDATGQLAKFSKCDPYVDLVRVDANNNVVERVQVKYIGKNAKDCFNKLINTSDYKKYYDPTKVDKMQIPKEYYSEIKNNLLPEKMSNLKQQIDYCEKNGKTEALEKNLKQLKDCERLNEMLESGSATAKETMDATKHPKIYNAKIFSEGVVKAGHSEGVKGGATAAAMTFCVSTVDNVTQVYSGEIEADEAVSNIIKDTATSGAIGYGTYFVSGAVAAATKESSHQLIKAIGGSNVPAAVVTMGVESYDEVVAYASGEIDAYEFAEKMGANASMVTGMFVGASIGQTVIPIPLVGGLVGGMVGCAVTSEAYQTAVEFVKENGDEIIETVEEAAEVVVDTVVDIATTTVDTVVDVASDIGNVVSDAASDFVDGAADLADKAGKYAADTVELVKEFAPEAAESVKSALNNFASGCANVFHL